GLEDATELNRLLDVYHDDLSQALPAFSETRKRETDAIEKISQMHYDFLTKFERGYFMRMEVARVMHQLLPRWYPAELKTVLSFTDAPYTQVVEMIARQNRWYKIGRL